MPQRIRLTYPTGDTIRYALSSDMTLAGIGPEQTSTIFLSQLDGSPFTEGGRYRVYWRSVEGAFNELDFEDFFIPVISTAGIQTGQPSQIRVTFPTGDNFRYALSADMTLAGISQEQTSTLFTTQTNGSPFVVGDYYRVYYREENGSFAEENFTEFYVKPAQTDRYHYTHVQNTPANSWAVSHKLGYKPAGIIVHDTAGNEWEPLVNYVDADNLILSFGPSSFAGRAEIS